VPLRQFQEKDGPQVKELVNSILFKEFSLSSKVYQLDDLDSISKAYNGPRDIFYVLEEDNKIVGTVGVKEDTKQVALLRRMYIHNNYRGRGYGSLLINAAIDFCKNNNYRQIVFRSTNQMQDAISLCLRKGFSEQEKLNLGDIQIIKFILKIPAKNA
jgi:putative acetyltransferase